MHAGSRRGPSRGNGAAELLSTQEGCSSSTQRLRRAAPNAVQGALFRGAVLMAPMLSLEKVSRKGINPYIRSGCRGHVNLPLPVMACASAAAKPCNSFASITAWGAALPSLPLILCAI